MAERGAVKAVYVRRGGAVVRESVAGGFPEDFDYWTVYAYKTLKLDEWEEDGVVVSVYKYLYVVKDAAGRRLVVFFDEETRYSPPDEPERLEILISWRVKRFSEVYGDAKVRDLVRSGELVAVDRKPLSDYVADLDGHARFVLVES